MNMSRTAIERAKDIVIVVLILSSILLLFFLWGNNAKVRFRLPVLSIGVNKTIQMQEIIIPEKITVNFGSENYTVILTTEEIWNSPVSAGTKSFVNALKDMAESGAISQNVITERDYQEITGNRSIQADFPYAIPLREYGAEYGINQLERMDTIDTFTAFAYSEASPESFFVSNKQDGKYYILTAQEEMTDFKNIIAAIEKKQNTTFYPLKTFAGVDNNNMIPLDLSIIMPEAQYDKHELWGGTDSSTGLNDMAKLYFGESFDFTKKVTEGNGTIVYVYGYGEKVLVIKTDGTFEYSSKSDISGNTGFFEALRTALEFIANHSEPGVSVGTGNNIYLKDVIKSSEGINGYRFVFGPKYEGYQVFYEKSDLIVIEVIGQKVVYSRFDEIVYKTMDVNKVPTEASPPFTILVEYYQYLYDILEKKAIFVEINSKDDVSDDEIPDVFNMVMEKVSDVSMGYLRKTSGGTSGKLIPVWRMLVSDVEFYFNLLTGEPEGYRY